MRETINMEWNNGELIYCLNLVAMGGDDDEKLVKVGHKRNSVHDYLDMQGNSALKQGEVGTATILHSLAMAVLADLTPVTD